VPVSGCGKCDGFADAGYDSGRGAAKVASMSVEGGKSVSVKVSCSFHSASADESTSDALRSEIGNVEHGYRCQLSCPGTAVVHRGMGEGIEVITVFVH
jgi:hypothetical protein